MTAILKSFPDMLSALKGITSYADALTTAIRRMGNIEVGSDPFHPDRGPKLVFKPVAGSHSVDYARTGKHTLLYSMEGTAKTYRVTIEPVQETHGDAA